MELTLFELIAVLLTATALFAWINQRFLGLPVHIGLLVMGLAASLLLVLLELLLPGSRLSDAVLDPLKQIDFYEAVMHGLLAFLLFAGALQVDVDRLRRRAAVVGTLATLGVLLSTAIMGLGLWLLTKLLGFPIALPWALVFGALIAPTDPVAVLSTLSASRVPAALETDLAGEALFNDGIGVVVFIVLLEAANEGGGLDLLRIGELLLVEACGGALLGLATGYLAYRALKSLDDYSVEVMISLALATGTYALADVLHMSGPIAVVVAGVLIAHRGVTHAMSDTTKRYMFGFWAIVDDVLNAVLFLLIGLEVLIVEFRTYFVWLALAVVPLSLVARLAAVSGPVHLLRRWHPFVPGTIPVLTWGGLHGGISIALALSLPYGPFRPTILAATYAVVLFSLIVQGTTLSRVIRHRVPAGARDESPLP